MKYAQPRIERTKLVGAMIDHISLVVCLNCKEAE